MKISIITATRNNCNLIAKTIESVISQTYENIEYIIVDGASTDGSLEIIKEYAQKYSSIIKYISEPDNGVYSAINKGIKMSSGNVVGLLHGNDYFSSIDVVAKVAKLFEDKTVPFVYGDVKYVKGNRDKVVRYYSASRISKELLLQGIAPPHPSLYMRRELFEKYGIYKEDYLIGADFDMFLRLIVVNKLEGQYLPLDMVTMTTGGLSTQLYHQIFTNNREKYRALKENSCYVSVYMLIKRYLYILKLLRKTK